MSNDMGFTIDGWDEFVENFSKFVDRWDAKKAELLMRMGNIYHAEIIPHVPVDTSRLVDSIVVFGDGIPQDYVEVGTNVEYALYVNDGHVQHKRFLPAERLTVGGKTKFACVDGPDFDGFEVDFDEAMARSTMYKNFERHEYEDACNLFKGV